MRRRELLAGAAAFGTVGAGAAAVHADWSPIGGSEAIDPVTLDRIDAAGSPAGTEQVPQPGRVTFVEFFATWCDVCERAMAPLGEAADRVDDDVQFLSVTNEPLDGPAAREAVAEWWADHDGRWPVAHDADLELSRRLDATGVPYAVVLDTDNRVAWDEQGYKEADELLSAIDGAR